MRRYVGKHCNRLSLNDLISLCISYAFSPRHFYSCLCFLLLSLPFLQASDQYDQQLVITQQQHTKQEQILAQSKIPITSQDNRVAAAPTQLPSPSLARNAVMTTNQASQQQQQQQAAQQIPPIMYAFPQHNLQLSGGQFQVMFPEAPRLFGDQAALRGSVAVLPSMATPGFSTPVQAYASMPRPLGGPAAAISTGTAPGVTNTNVVGGIAGVLPVQTTLARSADLNSHSESVVTAVSGAPKPLDDSLSNPTAAAAAGAIAPMRSPTMFMQPYGFPQVSPTIPSFAQNAAQAQQMLFYYGGRTSLAQMPYAMANPGGQMLVMPSAPTSSIRLCIICGKEAVCKCSLCGLQFYCSRQCQLQAWPSHKLSCVPVTCAKNTSSVPQ